MLPLSSHLESFRRDQLIDRNLMRLFGLYLQVFHEFQGAIPFELSAQKLVTERILENDPWMR